MSIIAAGVVPQSSCNLSPIAPASTCSRKPSGNDELPFPRKPRLIRKAIRCFQHPMDVPGAGRTSCRIRASRWTSSAADQRRQPVRECFRNDLGTNEVDVGIDATRRNDLAFCRQHFSAGPDLHPLCDPDHQIRIAGLADPRQCGHRGFRCQLSQFPTSR